jgi:hypothetical protein
MAKFDLITEKIVIKPVKLHFFANFSLQKYNFTL